MTESETPETEAFEPTEEQHIGLRDEFIAEIAHLIDENQTDRILELCRDLPAPDAGELLLKMDRERRHRLAETLDDAIPAETFAYLDSETLNDLLAHIPARHIATIINDLDSDDALHLVESLDEERRANVMRHLHRHLRVAVEEALSFPEDSAGRLMQREFVAIPQFWTIGKTVDYLRAAAATLPETFNDIFIVDPMHRFVGSVMLSRVLCAQRAVKIDTLVNEEHVTVPVGMDRSEVALIFSRRDLLSAPVVDDSEQLLGVITVDDVVDVINEEAERDFLAASGVSDSDIHSPVAATASSRFFWLAINLVTAFAAASVINLFRGAIEKVAALAVLMPIVAGMGGNAGGQTLAVAVRALATKDLSSANSTRVIAKELSVGVINGALFGAMIGCIVFLWFHDIKLGLIMGTAMLVNLTAAGLAGAGIPLIMQRLGHDPAQSAVVFLTTVTDVIGFFSFLGLATWVLL